MMLGLSPGGGAAVRAIPVAGSVDRTVAEGTQGAVPADRGARLDAAAVSAERPLIERLCRQRESLMIVALSLCNNFSQAEDLVQETLTRALERLDSLRCEDRLEPWMRRILVNLFRDQHRRREPSVELDGDTPSAVGSPEQVAERGEFYGHTRRAIDELSPRLRQVVGLVCLSELSYAEAAAVMGVPIGTVMSRLSRARQALRPMLERCGASTPAPCHGIAATAMSWEGGLLLSEATTAFF